MFLVETLFETQLFKIGRSWFTAEALHQAEGESVSIKLRPVSMYSVAISGVANGGGGPPLAALLWGRNYGL